MPEFLLIFAQTNTGSHFLRTGLSIYNYITVDDSCARHKGKDGYVTQVGNDAFTWFELTHSKSRVNFLQQLRAGDHGYRINDDALVSMKENKLPKVPLRNLIKGGFCYLEDAQAWEKYLDALGLTNERHRSIAKEGALLRTVLAFHSPSHVLPST